MVALLVAYDKDAPTKTNQTCPKCNKELVAMQYGYDSKFHYDGVSEYFCPAGVTNDATKSHYRIGRWYGRDLTGAEMEPKDCSVPYGHPMEMTIEQGNDESRYSPEVR